jgi:CheY-like chemotaxis protein
MEAMGRLVAGVAHDFNNLLSAIVCNLTFIGGMPNEVSLGDEEVRAGLADARSAAERAVDIVAQLLSFARKGALERRPTPLAPSIEELVRLVRRTFDKSVTVEADIAPDLVAYADPTELHQVLMNLCLNARDALPDGGRLTIPARPVSEARAARCGINGSAVAIAVRDEGIGIDDATRQRIFEPFFTPKARGRGTGLGLATVHGIVRAHGGTVLVDSAPGKGSTFSVLLPAASERPHRDELRETGTGRRRFRGRVLIVDDDDLVRRGNGRLVHQLGCEVVYAASGEAAIETFQARQDIDLVMMDLMMPGLSGEDTCARLREIAPDARVLFVSGYYDQSRLSALARDTTCRVLHKPFDLGALERAIDAALAVPAHEGSGA